MSDYPYSKEASLFDQMRKSGADIMDMSQNTYQMRQLSVATILSVPDDHILYKINILNSGQYKNTDAYLLAHPNYWNIVGFPQVNDLVLVMHQRGGGDGHILMRLQNKLKPILEDPNMNNADGIETGTLMA